MRPNKRTSAVEALPTNQRLGRTHLKLVAGRAMDPAITPRPHRKADDWFLAVLLLVAVGLVVYLLGPAVASL